MGIREMKRMIAKKELLERKKKYKDRIKGEILELKHYEKTRIPRCPHCKVNFKLVSGGETWGTWKPNCKCMKHIRLSVG